MIDYEKINIESSNLSSDIKKRLNFLLTTRVGTVVLDRDFGLKMDFIDKSGPMAKQLYTIEVIRKIKKYEPELRIESITFQFAESDITKMTPKLKITTA